MIAAPLTALAQVTDSSDRYLLRPQVDGDPRKPLLFSRSASLSPDPGRFTQPQTFSYQPARGARTTGFDSANRRQKDRKAGKAKLVTQNQIQNRSRVESQSPRQNPRENLTQQPHPAPASNVIDPGGALVDPPAFVPPLAPRRRPVPEDDPFIPTGVWVGPFVFKPAVEVTGAYDTNPARTASGTPSWYSVVAPELLVNSNWLRHELTANLRGSYTTYGDASELNRPNVDAKVNGRVEVTPWTRLDLEGRFIVGTDNPGSPNIQADLVKLPIFTTVGGSAGIGQRFNRLEVVTKAGADRTVYQNSTLTDGTTTSNADRDYIRSFAELRVNYELTPGVKPFVETGADRRVHDLAVDRNGITRDSDGQFVKGGSTFELSAILTGEAALGWVHRSYKEPMLPEVSGLTIDGSLTWLASALTAVKLTAKTSVDESTLVGVSGVLTCEVGLQVDHAFRRWLIATLKLTRATADYVGSPREDERYAASALLTYKLTREVWLKTEYRREWLHSNEPGNDYGADVFLFGLRLQR